MQLLLDFAGHCAGAWVANMAGPTTLRCRVLAVINASDTHMTGREIAAQAGVSYRQTIDALNALYNAGKIDRQGYKSTARWGKVRAPEQSPIAFLESVFLRGLKRA